MSIQQHTAIKQQVNGHGKQVRQVTVYTPERITELSLQLHSGKWVPYKRVVHSVH